MRRKAISAKDLTGRFYIETYVKAEIARAFLRDARDWRHLYLEIERRVPTRLSIRAKNFVNLRLCFECALKAIAVTLSKRGETAEHVYGKIRRCSHDLVKLLAACERRSNGRFRIVTPSFRDSLGRISNLDIGVRYDLDFKTRLKAQDLRGYLFDGPVTGVVIDEDFQKAAFTEATAVYQRAHAIYDTRFEKHKAHTGLEAVWIEDYIRRILL